MDSYLGGGAPTADEVAALDAVLADSATALSPAELLPALHALNDRVGWISRAGIDEIARRLDMAPAVIYGVASFYAMFSTEPRPPTIGYVCDDVPCRIAGAQHVVGDLEAKLAPEHVVADDAEWERSPCLGLCDMAPAAVCGSRAVPHATAADVVEALGLAATERAAAGGVRPPAGPPPHAHVGGLGTPRLLRRIGARVDPLDFGAYTASGGLAGLRRAHELGPEGTLAELKASGLIGRGGAAFPTAIKWEAVARSPVLPHYLVVNADESETGTFKDRVLVEWDPFALLEGIAIAASACGAGHAFIYLRGEYPHAYECLRRAIAEASRRELLRIPVTLYRGAGAYICGEETALFNSIEGKRGEPRSKPPFPVAVGLFGKPTVINNVETLVNLPVILAEGAAAFRACGTEASPGTKLFALSGHVERPGVYEVPFGTPLRALVEELGGGIRGGGELQAIQCGGAAGTFLTPADLDLPLTFEDMRARGATIGSGAVVVFDTTVDVLDAVRRGAEFFAHESCGQCVPCRVGTQRQVELLDRVAAGEDVRGLLADVALVMRDASICGLGQTAASMVQSAVKELGLIR